MTDDHAHESPRQASTSTELHAPDHDAHAAGHAAPLWLLAAVFAALLVLTGATVAVTQIQLGPLNVWLALLIATVKAALVVLYFMHLRWDSPFNATILISALLFVAVLTGAVIHDSREYRPLLDRPQSTPRRVAVAGQRDRRRPSRAGCGTAGTRDGAK
ncbi:MAG: cytochrome C oxidase subunit IV family protein [Phycisphaeraceae bacterium]